MPHGALKVWPAIAAITLSVSVLLALVTACAHMLNADVGGFHRVVGQRLVLVAGDALGLGVVAPLLDEGVVGRVLDRLEVVPRRQVADQRLGVDAAQFFLADRERHHRHVGRLQALVAEFLVEGHVAVAVDGRDDRGLLAFAGELLDLGDDGLVVGSGRRACTPP